MRRYRGTGRKSALALCTVIGLTGVFSLCQPRSAWADAYEMTDGAYRMPDGTAIDGVIARGIDVSRWQGNIDWNAAAADDVTFVMLGTRSKGAVDPYFHANVTGASAAGIRVGAYIYSLATTPEMALEEADFVLDLVKDYPISFPIAFDAEDSATLGTLPQEEVSEIINTFCERIAEAGYYPIVYANDNWLAKKIDMSAVPYDVWVARYGVRHNYADPIMWQATSSGSINGIAGNVDIDFLYQDLTPHLPGSLWRIIGEKTYYYQDYEMQKDTWISDGTGWFYMDQEGLASKGWLYKTGLYYYLDAVTGRMVTGWKQLENSWYFFNGSGAMNTGWLDDNGVRYYLRENGAMVTGWQDLTGKRYYFNDSGQMTTGWISLDNRWYYFGSDGAMMTGWMELGGARYYLNMDGTMATGWQSDGGTRYYLTDNGAAATGWKQLDGAWYYFNQNGGMAHGWVNPDGSWYYLGSDGKMMIGWVNDQGKDYYTSTSSGKMTVGWREVDGSWYCFDGSGALMKSGLTDMNGVTYYLNPADGRMAVSTTLDFDGVDYTVDENGVCTKVDETAEADINAGTDVPPAGSGSDGGNSVTATDAPQNGNPQSEVSQDGPPQNGDPQNGSSQNGDSQPPQPVGPGV